GGRREHLELGRRGRARAPARVVVASAAAGEREHRHRQHGGKAGPGPEHGASSAWNGVERVGRHARAGDGSSTTTLVALTAATASTPGARRSSSAASRVISDTTRGGPACTSTCATISSLTTLVTMPVNRLRADCAITSSGSVALHRLVMNSASAAPPTHPSARGGPL